MKKVVALAAGVMLLLGMFAGCAPNPPEQDAYKVLDEAIHDVESTFVRFLNVDPDGPAEDVVSAVERLSSEWAAVAAAAEGLEGVDISAAQAAYDELVDATAQVPDEMTASEALRAIQPVLDAFKAEVDKVHDALDLH
ncbi:MAG: hypothetical protein KGZ40_07005 [Clostridiales bacterium]|nr:hypothetical protein [Clostridiales bacterium]